jgi:hypothetical protein
VKRVAEQRPPPEVDRAEVKRDVEAKWQARKQREQDAAAAAAAAKRPVGRPKGKPGPAVPGPAAAAAPQQLVCGRAGGRTRAGGRVGVGGRSRPLPSRAGRGRWWWWTRDVAGSRPLPSRAGSGGSWWWTRDMTGMRVAV